MALTFLRQAYCRTITPLKPLQQLPTTLCSGPRLRVNPGPIVAASLGGVSLFFFKPKPAQSGRKQCSVGEDRYGDHRIIGRELT